MAKLTAAEVFEEVDWLRECGMHPAVVAAQLGRTAVALEKLGRVHGRPDIYAFFKDEAYRERPDD